MNQAVLYLIPALVLVLLLLLALSVLLSIFSRFLQRKRRGATHSLRLWTRRALQETKEEDLLRLKKHAKKKWKKEVILDAARSVVYALDKKELQNLENLMDSLKITDQIRKNLVKGDALERTEAAEAVGELRLKSAKEELFVAMRDGDMGVRLAAAAAFSVIDPVAAGRVLVNMLTTEPLVPAKGRIAELLLGNKEGGKHVLAAVEKNPSPILIQLLYKSSVEEEALPVLVSFAQSLDPAVRLEAVRALGTYASSWSVPTLVHALTDTDPFIRSVAAASLGQSGDPAALPHLTALLADKDHVVRSRAAGAVGRLEGGMEVLTQLVENNNKDAGNNKDAEDTKTYTANLSTDALSKEALAQAAATALQTQLARGGVNSLLSEDIIIRCGAERAVRSLVKNGKYLRLAEHLRDTHLNPEVRKKLAVLIPEALQEEEKEKVVLPGYRESQALPRTWKDVKDDRRRKKTVDGT